jgi:DNA-binding beta-propeller fold protein YncE
MLTKTVGTGPFAYEAMDDWEHLPEDWEHGDVADVAVDSRDRVYVFNRGDHPVIIFEPDGTFFGAWGESFFTKPHGITIGPDDSVYCVDDGAHAVYKFTLDGKLLLTLGTPGTPCDNGYVFGQYMSVKEGGPPFNRPTALAVAPNGDLYVTDGYGNACVHCFSPGGDLKFSWGAPGSGPGEFRIPHAIRFMADGRILVADRENSRVQIFSQDGQYLEEWKDTCRPDGLAIDSQGNVYLCDLGLRAGRYPTMPSLTDEDPPSRVSVFSSTGSLLARWGSPEPCIPGSFFAAHGITVDSQGDVYVVEVNYSAGGKAGLIPANCHTVQKFVRAS